MTAYVTADAPESFISTTETFPSDDKQFLGKLDTVYCNIAKNLNSKDIGRYELTEVINGQQFFDTTNAQARKSVYRKCFSFGSMASGATLNIAHGITGIPSAGSPTGKTIFTRIYGTYLDDSWYQKPIPYAVFSAPNIGYQFDIKVDATNIILVNGTAGTATAVQSGIIVLEYVKN